MFSLRKATDQNWGNLLKNCFDQLSQKVQLIKIGVAGN